MDLYQVNGCEHFFNGKRAHMRAIEIFQERCDAKGTSSDYKIITDQEAEISCIMPQDPAVQVKPVQIVQLRTADTPSNSLYLQSLQEINRIIRRLHINDASTPDITSPVLVPITTQPSPIQTPSPAQSKPAAVSSGRRGDSDDEKKPASPVINLSDSDDDSEHLLDSKEIVAFMEKRRKGKPTPETTDPTGKYSVVDLSRFKTMNGQSIKRIPDCYVGTDSVIYRYLGNSKLTQIGMKKSDRCVSIIDEYIIL
jgi:hypothetical protein